jgi:hypothetical protein
MGVQIIWETIHMGCNICIWFGLHFYFMFVCVFSLWFVLFEKVHRTKITRHVYILYVLTGLLI